MKNLLIIGAALAVLAVPAFANDSKNGGGTSFSQAGSEATSTVDVTTGAAAGVIINQGQYGDEALGSSLNPYNGTTNVNSSGELRTAPSLGGLALGGGHPCAYSPSTAQISIIGGGAGFGGMKVDSACMLMVMGAAGDSRAYAASTYMIAARDPAACTAMRSAGMVSDCVEKGSILRPKPRPSSFAASTKGTDAPANCRYDKATNTVTVKRGTDKAACLAALGF